MDRAGLLHNEGAIENQIASLEKDFLNHLVPLSFQSI